MMTTTTTVREQMHYRNYKIACFNYSRWYIPSYISGLPSSWFSLALLLRISPAREESLHHNRSSGVFLRVGPPTDYDARIS